MTFELAKTMLMCYDNILSSRVNLEKTEEAVVPDSQPDILRIVDTTATVWVKDKQVGDGRIRTNGTARVRVIYSPEGDGALRKLD